MSFKQNYYLIVVFLVLINTSNIVYIFLYNVSNSNIFITLGPAVKDLALLLLFFSVLLGQIVNLNFRYKKSYKYLVSLVILLLILLPVSFFLSEAPVMNRLYNFRMLIMFPIAFWTFLNIKIDYLIFEKIMKFFQKLTIVILTFGIIEYLLPLTFWDQIIGLNKFTQNRPLGESDVLRYLSADLIFLTGDYVRRMMSFYAEPTTFGAFVTFVFCLSMFAGNQLEHSKSISILALICGLLIISKLFLLTLLLVFYYKVVHSNTNFYPLIIFTVLLYFISAYFYFQFGKVHGSFAHLFGFYTGINTIFQFPLGLGLGMAGNRGIIENRSALGELGSESGIGAVIAQLGVLGLLFFVFLLAILSSLKRKYYISGNSIYIGLFLAMISYIINFYLSFASLGFTGNIMFFIFSGLFLNSRISLGMYTGYKRI